VKILTSNLCILGSTGSIGTQALNIAKKLGISVSALAAHSNIKLLEEQAREFKPALIAVFDGGAAGELKKRLKDMAVKIVDGYDGLCEAVALSNVDTVLNALVGIVGLVPTFEAIKCGKQIALANKETLVAGGRLLMEAAKKNKVAILPVDSEHSAIFQCLEGCRDKSYIKKILLTASGGPLFGKSNEELKNVAIDDVLKHPNWNMGKKVTVDSASLMNKGLELIEAVYLFGVSPDFIEVVIHRESLIHSMVEYKDNSVIAQIASKDMHLPIQYALTWPERASCPVDELNFANIGTLSFYKPDEKTFPLLELCRKAVKIGGGAPAFICSADEEAVNLFLRKKISFLGITELVERIFEKYSYKEVNNVEDILEVDRQAKELVKEELCRGYID
jgi:1-deoxy-D-xylulose-5-phosphate reductoisomerase